MMWLSTTNDEVIIWPSGQACTTYNIYQWLLCGEPRPLQAKKNKKPLGFKFRPLSVTRLPIAFSKMNL